MVSDFDTFTKVIFYSRPLNECFEIRDPEIREYILTNPLFCKFIHKDRRHLTILGLLGMIHNSSGGKSRIPIKELGKVSINLQNKLMD